MNGAGVKKSVQIISNDTSAPEFSLDLTGDILSVLEVDSKLRKVELRGLAGTELVSEFVLKQGSHLEVEILESEVSSGNARVDRFEPVEGEPGSWSVRLVADAVDRPLIFNEKFKIDVRTSDGQEREVSFPFRVEHNARVQATPKGQLKFIPREIAKLYGPNPQPISRAVLLNAGGEGIRFNVLEVRLDENLEGVVKTEVTEQRPGEQFAVHVRIEEWQEKRQMIGRMTIVTDDPECGEISLWVMALFTPPDGGGGSR